MEFDAPIASTMQLNVTNPPARTAGVIGCVEPMEFRRFLTNVHPHPPPSSSAGPAHHRPLLGHQPSLDRLFSAWHTIGRTRFG